MARRRIKGLKAYTKALKAFCSKKAIHEHLATHHGHTLINVVVSTAKANIGPGNREYKPYSASYKKAIKRAGGFKAWLRGIGRGGRKGGMLDPDNFKIEVLGNGRAFLVWDGPDEMKVYAEVHQGSARGGRTHSTGQIPARPFLHFENKENAAALIDAYEQTWTEMAAQFNRGRIPK